MLVNIISYMNEAITFLNCGPHYVIWVSDTLIILGFSMHPWKQTPPISTDDANVYETSLRDFVLLTHETLSLLTYCPCLRLAACPWTFKLLGVLDLAVLVSETDRRPSGTCDTITWSRVGHSSPWFLTWLSFTKCHGQHRQSLASRARVIVNTWKGHIQLQRRREDGWTEVMWL